MAIGMAAVIVALTMTLEAVGAGASTGGDGHVGIPADADSFTCLTCHDGSMAPYRPGHPIDVSYAVAALTLGARLREVSALPVAVRLENGRVGCRSCHDLRSSLRAKLALSNDGSRLCFACHEL